jgi:hypothetical protein
MGHQAAGTLPSSTAACVIACKSVTPSEAVLGILCAIFALVADLWCDLSMRSTAESDVDVGDKTIWWIGMMAQ